MFSTSGGGGGGGGGRYQYIGWRGRSLHRGDVQYIGWWGRSIHWGDTMSTLGDILMFSTSEGYHKYTGGVKCIGGV